MVEAVSRHGFAGTTLAELVTLAGVSKTTFYQHFDNKEDCFLAAFDSIIAEVTERVGVTFREPGNFHLRLTAALTAFMEIAAGEPAAASFTTVDSLTLGKAGVAHRERSVESFQLMVRQSFDHSPSKVEVSDLTVRAIVGGIRGVVYRRMRADEADQLPGLVEELVTWTLSYQSKPRKAVRRALAAAEQETAVGDATNEGRVSWEEPPDSQISRRTLSQRERIVRGAARVVVERGYVALSIPAISGAAGVSNQTFYEHFQSKRDAFLAAFQLMTEDVLQVASRAFVSAGDRTEAIGASLHALLAYVASHELYARLAFFELPTAGPLALDEADRIFDSFTAFLPGAVPDGVADQVSATTLQAIASGIWETIQFEIVHERRRSLAELAPEITWIALAPFNSAG
jgi:AcrR family transcriptional regulator